MYTCKHDPRHKNSKQFSHNQNRVPSSKYIIVNCLESTKLLNVLYFRISHKICHKVSKI